MCPLARQWTAFSLAVEPNFRLQAFVTDDDEDSIELDLFRSDEPALRFKSAMNLLGMTLSQIDEDSPLSQGFHIVSIPLSTKWTQLPPPDRGPYILTCVATAEPEAKELLTMDPTLTEMTGSSILDLRVIPPGATTCAAFWQV